MCVESLPESEMSPKEKRMKLVIKKATQIQLKWKRYAKWFLKRKKSTRKMVKIGLQFVKQLQIVKIRIVRFRLE